MTTSVAAKWNNFTGRVPQWSYLKLACITWAILLFVLGNFGSLSIKGDFLRGSGGSKEHLETILPVHVYHVFLSRTATIFSSTEASGLLMTSQFS